jgi:hypothetical protein
MMFINSDEMEEGTPEYCETEVDPATSFVTAPSRSNVSIINTDRESADDLEWLQHSKLTGGTIKFLHDGSSDRKVSLIAKKRFSSFGVHAFCTQT